jgi:hypothetical protein
MLNDGPETQSETALPPTRTLPEFCERRAMLSLRDSVPTSAYCQHM